MAVDAGEIDELRRARAAMSPDEFFSGVFAFDSMAEALAYAVAEARAAGWSEADMTETLVRLLELPPGEVRAIEKVLRPLGYGEVANMLKRIRRSQKAHARPIALK
jgi:tRNA A58 N-methylase Trm61